MKAFFCSEERHAEVSILCSSEDKYSLACQISSTVLNDLGFQPDILVKRCHGELGGELSIEFPDDYDRNAGKFIEAVSQKLDLSFENR